MVFPKNNLFMQKIALGTESRFPTLRVSRNFLLFKGGIESTHERASERLVCLSHKVKLTTDGHSRHLECEGKVRPTPPFPTPKVVQGLCLSLSRFRSIQLGRSFVLCQCSGAQCCCRCRRRRCEKNILFAARRKPFSFSFVAGCDRKRARGFVSDDQLFRLRPDSFFKKCANACLFFVYFRSFHIARANIAQI